MAISRQGFMTDNERKKPSTTQDRKTALGKGTEVDQSERSTVTSSSVFDFNQHSNKFSNGTAQQALNQTLNFLSNASNETLGACLAGLAAVTYLILGRVGLVLIGVLVGVVLHSGWEENGRGSNEFGAEAEVKRREAGLSIVTRILDLRQTKGEAHEILSENKAMATLSSEDQCFGQFPKDVRRALSDLTDAVVRDYVRYESRVSAW